MKIPSFIRSLLFLGGLLLSAPLPGANTTLELVQSVPVETSLSSPGLRSAADVWLEMVQHAQKTLDIEQFYFTSTPENGVSDPLMQKVAAAIADAGRRGVQVRVLLDSSFYKTYPADAQALAKVPHIVVKILDLKTTTGGILHAKFFVADDQQAFLGSQNFDWRALDHIHEIGVRTGDPVVTTGLLAVFNKDWSHGALLSGNDTPPASLPVVPGNATLRFLASPKNLNPPGIDDTLSALLGQIHAAQKSIDLQTYEYSVTLYGSSEKWPVLQDALLAAAQRGVKIHLLLDRSKVSAAKAALYALAASPNLEVRSVLIPPWSGGKIAYARLVHSKYILFDGTTAWVGTENLSGSYFTNSRNVGILFTNVPVVTELSQVFQLVWNSPYAAPVKPTTDTP